MSADPVFHEGRSNRPVLIFIHGLGMNRHFWTDPGRCQALGGLASLTLFLSLPPTQDAPSCYSAGIYDSKLQGLGTRLAAAGYSVVSWSQQQPVGPLAAGVEELAAVVKETKKRWPGRLIFLVGHSRGGLIAKQYLLDAGCDRVAGLITIGTPHAGSKMANFSKYLHPAGLLLKKVLPTEARKKSFTALTRLSAFLNSPAAAELCPESPLIASLRRPLPASVATLSFGGTDPVLFRLFVRGRTAAPWRTLAFPEILVGALPERRLPPELRPGRGDGLVAADSAVLPGGHHYDFPANHVKIAYDGAIQDLILDFLGEHS